MYVCYGAMEIGPEQYERVAPYPPAQRENVSIPNLQVRNAILYVARAIAFEIYRPVTPAKAGVQRAQNEDNDLETADFRHWIPAFAGMTVAESAGLMS